MKRILLIMFLVISVLASNLRAQDTLSHWSIGAKGGLDYFRVTPVSTKTGFSNYIDDMGWTFPGVFLEYTINPLVGFGGSIDYLTFDRNTAKGNTLDFSLFGSVNLANLLTPKRDGFWGKVDVYGNWGGGLGFYSNRLVSTGEKHSLMSPLVTSALSLEYKISDAWALRTEAQYRYYFREDLGGISSSMNSQGGMVYGNDAFALTIGLRYKFGTRSKKHVRNLSVGEYYNQPEKNNLVTESRLKAIEDENEANKEKIQKLEANLKALNDEKDANKAQLQNDLKEIPQAKVDNNGLDSTTVLLDVNFEFASYKLQPKTRAILDQVALVLKVNKAWSKLVVSGYTDSIGGDKINKNLSEERANVVKEYLIYKGLTASAIITAGFGKENPKASNKTKEGRYKNRRAELVVKK
ncbi:MAG: OmpA family protein [Paludibacter sp.]|nr:OmpA family protein [Paludibacter sp.]